MEVVDETFQGEEVSNAQAIIVQETELVSLVPQAEDPDGDTLVFEFTSPLNGNGEWQTTYGDEGEYTITVTVSDGELTTTQDILLIVNRKEENPIIEDSSPTESAVEIRETESMAFSVRASDLNNDPLIYMWKLDGIEVGEGNDFEYQTTYDDEGSHTVKVDVGDGNAVSSQLWAVNVINLNRVPVLEFVDSITIKEGNQLIIMARAADEDGDELTFAINDDRFDQEDGTFTWDSSYDDAGFYEVTLSVSDGSDTEEQLIAITVENVNRRPVIVDIIQK